MGHCMGWPAQTGSRGCRLQVVHAWTAACALDGAEAYKLAQSGSLLPSM